MIGMNYEFAERLKNIPPYLFAEIEEKVSKKKAEGVDILDFGIGDPDLPTPKLIIDEIKKQLDDPQNYQYSSSAGERETRVAVAEWYKTRFNVDLDPDKEVVILLGSKEGLANFARAFANAGDKILCPDPAYPVYSLGAALLCDAYPEYIKTYAEDGFLPRLDTLPQDGKMLYVNFPNNPTGATAPVSYLKDLLQWGEESKTIICYDNAYSEMTYDDYLAPSILEFGRNAIEFGSLSKTFNMTGYRIGYAVGDEKLITGLKKVKSQTDSGAPKFIQKAAVTALKTYTGPQRPAIVQECVDIYGERRDIFVDGLRELGINAQKPKGTFYLFVDVGMNALEFAEKMLDVGIVVTPGTGYGEAGEGFVRIALTQPKEKIFEALERMRKVL